MENIFNEARELVKTERTLTHIAERTVQVDRQIEGTKNTLREMITNDQFDGVAEANRQLTALNRQKDRLIEKQAEVAETISDRLASLLYVSEELQSDAHGVIEKTIDAFKAKKEAAEAEHQAYLASMRERLAEHNAQEPDAVETEEGDAVVSEEVAELDVADVLDQMEETQEEGEVA